jgi:hypothetical protein
MKKYYCKQHFKYLYFPLFSEITFIGSYTLDNPNLGNPNYNSNLYVKLENRNRLSGYILSRKGGSTIKKTFTATRIE